MKPHQRHDLVTVNDIAQLIHRQKPVGVTVKSKPKRNGMQGVKFPIGAGVGKIKYRTDAREEYINHAMKAVNVDLRGLKIERSHGRTAHHPDSP